MFEIYYIMSLSNLPEDAFLLNVKNNLNLNFSKNNIFSYDDMNVIINSEYSMDKIDILTKIFSKYIVINHADGS